MLREPLRLKGYACPMGVEDHRRPDPRREWLKLAALLALVLAGWWLFQWADRPASAVDPTPQPARPATGPTFEGFDCKTDCSGHEAGYEWARRNDVTSAAECENRSKSFEEGCVVYLENERRTLYP